MKMIPRTITIALMWLTMNETKIVDIYRMNLPIERKNSCIFRDNVIVSNEMMNMLLSIEWSNKMNKTNDYPNYVLHRYSSSYSKHIHSLFDILLLMRMSMTMNNNGWITRWKEWMRSFGYLLENMWWIWLSEYEYKEIRLQLKYESIE